MKEFTQTSMYPRGNCWQTAVACVLDVDPDELPSQADSYFEETQNDGTIAYRLRYHNALTAYLWKHHGLAYIEFHQPEEALSQLSISGYHLMTGNTVRTAQFGCRHVVVGKDGALAWDPHPDRAGLLDEIRWAVLAPFPKSWERNWSDEPCVCPKCKPAVKP